MDTVVLITCYKQPNSLDQHHITSSYFIIGAPIPTVSGGLYEAWQSYERIGHMYWMIFSTHESWHTRPIWPKLEASNDAKLVLGWRCMCRQSLVGEWYHVVWICVFVFDVLWILRNKSKRMYDRMTDWSFPPIQLHKFLILEVIWEINMYVVLVMDDA